MRSLFIILALLPLVLNHSAHSAQRNLMVTTSAVQEQKRVALVIGNAAYQGAPALRNPVNDAKAMSNALNSLGFEVIEVTDAGQKEMNRAITAFGEKLNAETAALFFYAGHGLQVKGKNYIIPVDALIKTESAVASEAVSVDAVLEQLNANPVSIVILDACRNNPFERSFRKMGGSGLAQMDAPKGSFIAYATAPGKTANDGDGKNGLFTQELLKYINEPGLDLEKVFKRVRASVAAKSGDTQMPWDSSSMTGEFYFKPGVQQASLAPVPVQQAARTKSVDEIEDEYWDGIKDSSDITNFEQYRKAYPKGRYLNTANLKIAQLKKQAQENKLAETASIPATKPGREDYENALWAEAQKGNNKDDYDAYMAQYPKGKYVALARSRIKKLQDEAAAEAVRKEQDAWEAAGKSGSEDGYQNYLKNWPYGKYASLAHARIKKLQTDQEARKEQDAWDAAVRSESEDGYQNYLKGWPSGKYVSLAQSRIKKLQTDQAAREEQELWRKAEAGENAHAVQAYLDKYPGGNHVAAAQEKLAAILAACQKTVTDSTKVAPGEGCRVRGIGDREGEISGVPAPDSKFTQLRIGMSPSQVEALIGPPTEQKVRETPKARNPFYFGSDKSRTEYVYRSQGRLIFYMGRSSASAFLIWIIHNSSEP